MRVVSVRCIHPTDALELPFVGSFPFLSLFLHSVLSRRYCLSPLCESCYAIYWEPKRRERVVQNEELYVKKAPTAAKNRAQKDQEHGPTTAASRGSCLTKSLYDVLWIRVSSTVVRGCADGWVLCLDRLGGI